MFITELFKSKFNKDKVLLLVEPGGIGDYILVRPYLKFIKKSPKYKDYKIFYLAKECYADFVSAYDSSLFDDIISYNPKELASNNDYKRYLYKKLNKLNIDTVLNLRSIVVDNLPDWSLRKRLVKNIKAKNKIADVIKLKNNKRHERKLKIYSQIIYSENKIDFEFERRRLFFEKLLQINIPHQDSSFCSVLDSIDNNTVLMSMSSQSEYRNYPVDKCTSLLHKLLSVTDYKFALLGTKNQYEYNQDIINRIGNHIRIINLAGKTNITQLPDILKKCAFLIGVESGTIHIANSVGCNTFCLSNGSFYQRFHPYPQPSTVTYIYPDWFNQAISNSDLDLMDVYGGEQSWNLDDINFDNLCSLFEKKADNV